MILVAGFVGSNNSSKCLLDNIPIDSNIDKLYLVNNFEKCACQIKRSIEKTQYEFILAFGQKSVIKSIYIERCGYVDGERYKTTYKYDFLIDFLVKHGYRVRLSDNAGNYLCNHVYGFGLRYIEQRSMDTPYAFIHIPNMGNISNIVTLANTFYEYLMAR